MPFPHRIVPAACLAIMLAACRPAELPESAVGGQAAAPLWPVFDFAAAAASGQAVHRLDPAQSRIEIVVRRAGPLARFGHDHVIAVREAEGYLLLAQTIDASRVELRFPVAALDVDPADGRSRHQLDTQPDAEDIAGTKANLLEKVLDSDAWPFISVSAGGMSGEGDQISADVTFHVQDRQTTARQLFKLDRSASKVRVDGRFKLRQTDLGLEPFSALGGGLSVADEMEIHFRISGHMP